MDTRFEHLGELSPTDRADFLRGIARNEALRREYAVWLVISDRIRQDQSDLIADGHLLVLAALQRAGFDSSLDAEERALVRESWPDVEARAASVTFLDDVQRRIAGEAHDFEESWRLREGHLLPYRPVSTSDGSRRLMRGAWRISAAAAVVMFVAILLFVAKREASWVKIEVTRGRVQNIALVDGSTIRLVGPTTLRYRVASSPAKRPEVVRLSGDAFFDIAPSDAGFVVETLTALVAVVGTSFGVRSQPTRTDVVVATGKVWVMPRSGDKPRSVLSEGESCIVLRDEDRCTPVEVNLGEALAWADLFVFRSTSLSEIVVDLSRHYRVTVTVDPPLADETITGTFDRSRQLKDILNVLATTLGGVVVESPEGFRLKAGI